MAMAVVTGRGGTEGDVGDVGETATYRLRRVMHLFIRSPTMVGSRWRRLAYLVHVADVESIMTQPADEEKDPGR
jgi:hypothetical protein